MNVIEWLDGVERGRVPPHTVRPSMGRRRREVSDRESGAMSEALTIVPANETSWEEIQTVFGTRGTAVIAMITESGKEVIWDEVLVGARRIFAAAGFAEVSHPTPRRVVTRIDFSA